jgi:hypothetical protein
MSVQLSYVQDFIVCGIRLECKWPKMYLGVAPESWKFEIASEVSSSFNY